MKPVNRNQKTCGKCGAELTGVGAEQLCPGCLLEGGLDAVEAFGENAANLAPAEGTRAINGTGNVGVHDTNATGDFTPAAPGQQFGDYELLSVIARGGMGFVYKARRYAWTGWSR